MFLNPGKVFRGNRKMNDSPAVPVTGVPGCFLQVFLDGSAKVVGIAMKGD